MLSYMPYDTVSFLRFKNEFLSNATRCRFTDIYIPRYNIFLYRWILREMFSTAGTAGSIFVSLPLDCVWKCRKFSRGLRPRTPHFFSFLVKILNWWISSVVISFISFLLVCEKSQLMNLISCRSILKIILSNLISEGRVRLFFYQFCALMASVREKYRWEFSFNDYLCSEISHSLMLRVESIRETAACISLHFL